MSLVWVNDSELMSPQKLDVNQTSLFQYLFHRLWNDVGINILDRLNQGLNAVTIDDVVPGDLNEHGIENSPSRVNLAL